MASYNLLFDEITSLARATSFEAIKTLYKFEPNDNPQNLKSAADRIPHQIDRLAFVVIGNWSLKLTFRIYFSSNQSPNNPRISLNIENRVRDSAREYCNYVGGKIMRSLESDQMPMGISIPVDCRSSRKQRKPMSHQGTYSHSSWQINGQHSLVICSVSIEVVNPESIGKIQFKKQITETNESDLEFL